MSCIESGISDTALNSMPFNNIMVWSIKLLYLPTDLQYRFVSVSFIQKGVRFALSGFKNPYRGQLRDKALAMGAKYEPDWGPSCTHLV